MLTSIFQKLQCVSTCIYGVVLNFYHMSKQKLQKNNIKLSIIHSLLNWSSAEQIWLWRVSVPSFKFSIWPPCLFDYNVNLLELTPWWIIKLSAKGTNFNRFKDTHSHILVFMNKLVSTKRSTVKPCI